MSEPPCLSFAVAFCAAVAAPLKDPDLPLPLDPSGALMGFRVASLAVVSCCGLVCRAGIPKTGEVAEVSVPADGCSGSAVTAACLTMSVMPVGDGVKVLVKAPDGSAPILHTWTHSRACPIS